MKSDILGYSMGFISHLTLLDFSKKGIRSIILYGSAVTENFRKESDIDIFIDASLKKDYIKSLEQQIEKETRKFFNSVVYKQYWKMLGITNTFHIIVDNLDDYKLKDSIISQGIILYGSYKDMPKGKLKTIISWRNVKPENKRINLHRKLYGYSYMGKEYEGLLEKFRGETISSGCISIDSQLENEFLSLFKELSIRFNIRKVLEIG